MNITDVIAAEQDSRTYNQGRVEAFGEACAVVDKLIIGVEDSYRANKGEAAGLVAFGQKIALRGLSERLHWLAAGHA